MIAGHVDSEHGPAIFYRLGEMERGDTIHIKRTDGTTAIFTVDAVRSYPKTDFPTAAVYGNTRRAALRLITCGDWNVDSEEYEANVVVFAHLLASPRKVRTPRT